jgi:hypothetical protein
MGYKEHHFPSDTEALASPIDGMRSETLMVQMRTGRGPEVIELAGKQTESLVVQEMLAARPEALEPRTPGP